MKPLVVAQGLISYRPVVTSLRPSALCMMKSMPRLIIHHFCATHHFVVLHNWISKSSNTHKKSIKEAWIISVKEKCDKRNSSQCTSGGVETKKAQTGEIAQKQDSAHIEHHLFFSFFYWKTVTGVGELGTSVASATAHTRQHPQHSHRLYSASIQHIHQYIYNAL